MNINFAEFYVISLTHTILIKPIWVLKIKVEPPLRLIILKVLIVFITDVLLSLFFILGIL